MIIQALLLKLFLQVGIGTVFSSVDKYNPDPHLACFAGKKLKDSTLVIAHREIKCGERVVVCNLRTQLCTTAVTSDRGPFGRTGQHFTSIVDMSPGVQKAIQHNGLELVVVGSTLPIPNKPPKKKVYVRKTS